MTKRILTVTLNPCIDKTMVFDTIIRGGLNRAVFTRTDYCGKGINVAKAVAALGSDVLCLGLNYSNGGDALEKSLEAEGVPFDFVRVAGTLRMNVKVYDNSAKEMTELNEAGGEVSQEKTEELIKKIIGLADSAGVIALSGSVPAGVPKNIYKRIIASLPGKKIILDADGDAFTEGLKAGPYAVKPNLFELETAFGVKLSSPHEAAEFCRRIMRESLRGVNLMCVSMGARGALVTDGEHSFFAPAPAVDVRAVQGAGDAMVAGICLGLLDEQPPDEILRRAMAAAGASIMREGSLMCTAEGYRQVYERVTVDINAT